MTETGQSERLIKSKLFRRCIKCLDYDGKTSGMAFRERMKKESEIAKSEEESAIALLGRLGIESRVIENKHDESVESSEFKKLKENVRNETASAYIRQTTIDGLIKIQRILKMIDKAAINRNITLSESDKIIMLKKKISDETMEDFHSVNIYFKKELFTEIFKNFKDSAIDSLSQLVNFALYENASDGRSALGYDFDYFFKIGYLSNCIASRSRGTAYESYSTVQVYLDKNVKNDIDEVAANNYLKQSVISAEKVIPKLLEKVKNGGIKKSLDKIVTTQVTPVYYYCIYWNSDALKASRDLRAIINQSPDEYFGLRKILDTLRDEKNAEINELRDAAESGKASISQLKNLHDLVSNPIDKFKYLAKACTLGLKDKRGKTLINSQNINKLKEYLKVIGISESPELRDYFGHDFEFATFIEMMEGKASLKKILNKGVKSGQISENQSFEILSSDKNFSCPECAETIGSNTKICPYCKNKLS